jgi:DNA-binding response OmpR family regulator
MPIPRKVARSPRMCYWILCQDPESSKPYLIFGSDRSEEDARSKGFEMLGGLDFTIKPLRTRNLQRASAIIRGTRLEDTHSLKSASERIGHERSVRRRLRGRRR